MNPNIHGLTRHIPAKIKREIRRRSKHGCVFCRAMIYQYEHIEPEFAQALDHNPEAICLLCPNCHAEVTAGRVSKQEVFKAYRHVQTSNSVRPPHHQMRLSGKMLLRLGTSQFDFLADQFSILEYDGQSILGIRYIEDRVLGGIYPSISGVICDKKGAVVLEIDDNEITLSESDFDVEAVGPVLRIRNSASEFDLQFTFEPPGGLKIDRLHMRFKEIEIDTRDDFGVTGPTLNNRRARLVLGQIRTKGCVAAVTFTSDRSSWKGDGISMNGGEGIALPFMGLAIAKCAGAMTLPQLNLEWV
jgi:hypothetical protein